MARKYRDSKNCFFLGFDGGGTKTTCALVNGAGRLLAEAVGGPSNPLRVGFRRACAALVEAADQVCAFQYLEPSHIRGVCAGLAGAGRPPTARRVARFLEEVFPKAKVRVTTDLEIALEAVVGAEAAIVLIAGTGSAAFGRNAAGRTARAGGLGSRAGDEGSAFDIGRRALVGVERARKRRGPPTILGDRILGAVECSGWRSLGKRIAKNPDDVFPRIFPLVAEAADAGDTLSLEILSSAAQDLAALVRCVLKCLQLGGRACVIAKAGGVFGRSAFLDAAVDEQLRRLAPRARIRPLSLSPAVAAAQFARRGFAKVHDPWQPAEKRSAPSA